MTGKRVFLLATALAASNFIYQLLTGNADLSVATERSYFQAVALALAWLNT